MNTVVARSIILFFLGLLLLLVYAVQLPESRLIAGVLSSLSQGCANEHLEIHFLDVGQGDATLIVTPDCVKMLIDGGEDRQVLNRLGEVLSPFDRTINVVLGTHPHADHIGGLIDVLQRFTVSDIIITENTIPSQVADRFFQEVRLAEENGVRVHYARADQVYQLGSEVEVKILSPRYNPRNIDADTASIISKITYGDISVLITGDAPIVIEDLLVDIYGTELESTILKLGHHGSRTSTSAKFLDTVVPQYAITSAGRNNRHGHPHQEVIDRVLERNIIHLTTQEEGTISFFSDGQRLWR